MIPNLPMRYDREMAGEAADRHKRRYGFYALMALLAARAPCRSAKIYSGVA